MRTVLAILFCLFAWGANAQSGNPTRQSGNVTPGHVTCWTTDGTIQDCSNAQFPFATYFATVGQGPTLCADSAQPASGLYTQICMGATGLYWLGSTAPSFTINGVVYPFPFTSGSSVSGCGSTVINDLAIWTNTAGTLLCDSGIPYTALRQQLSGNLTYYVNGNGSSSEPCQGQTCAAGSDSNNGTARTAPFLTLAHACALAEAFDFNGHTVTIYVANGTYSSSLCSDTSPLVGAASLSAITIIGDNSSIAASIPNSSATWSTSPTNHGLSAGSKVAFSNAPTGFNSGQILYVIATGLTATAFEVSLTQGGSALTNTSGVTGNANLFRGIDNVVVSGVPGFSVSGGGWLTVSYASLTGTVGVEAGGSGSQITCSFIDFSGTEDIYAAQGGIVNCSDVAISGSGNWFAQAQSQGQWNISGYVTLANSLTMSTGLFSVALLGYGNAITYNINTGYNMFNTASMTGYGCLAVSFGVIQTNQTSGGFPGSACSQQYVNQIQ